MLYVTKRGFKMKLKTQIDRKSPAKAPPASMLFGEEVERMLASNVFTGQNNGYLNGSMSGESWKAFLKTVRDEAVHKLSAYRHEAAQTREFRASSLQPYCEQRMKIERDYMRALVDLYNSAERAYKTLSG